MLFESSSCAKKAVLLVQFGTPSSPNEKDVHSFVSSVLHDHLLPFLPLSVIHKYIVPQLLPKTVARYRSIWKEKDSPLLSQTVHFAKKLKDLLPNDTDLFLGMLQGTPSLQDSLLELQAAFFKKLVIFPLFPFHTSITKAIYKKCFSSLSTASFPIAFIDSFHQEPCFLESFAKRLSTYDVESYDHLLFSFHAIPFPSFSYKKNCIKAAQAIAKENFSVAFQSKIGCSWLWTAPSTKEILKKLFFQGKRRILVISPSFVVDCSETLGEIAIEYRDYFLSLGGEELTLVESLNDFDPWVKSTAHFLRSYL